MPQPVTLLYKDPLFCFSYSSLLYLCVKNPLFVGPNPTACIALCSSLNPQPGRWVFVLPLNPGTHPAVGRGLQGWGERGLPWGEDAVEGHWKEQRGQTCGTRETRFLSRDDWRGVAWSSTTCEEWSIEWIVMSWQMGEPEGKRLFASFPFMAWWAFVMCWATKWSSVLVLFRRFTHQSYITVLPAIPGLAPTQSSASAPQYWSPIAVSILQLRPLYLSPMHLSTDQQQPLLFQ